MSKYCNGSSLFFYLSKKKKNLTNFELIFSTEVLNNTKSKPTQRRVFIFLLIRKKENSSVQKTQETEIPKLLNSLVHFMGNI
jgi:hypothetical protein